MHQIYQVLWNLIKLLTGKQSEKKEIKTIKITEAQITIGTIWDDKKRAESPICIKTR